MAPLVVQLVAWAVFVGLGATGVMPAAASVPGALRFALAVMFAFTALSHFLPRTRSDLIRMVPPSVPNPGLMVTLTGVCEVLGAIGLLVPRTRRTAAVALILFLVAVLPANIHAARTGATLGGAPVTPLVPRVALQACFIAVLWWAGVRPKPGD